MRPHRIDLFRMHSSFRLVFDFEINRQVVFVVTRYKAKQYKAIEMKLKKNKKQKSEEHAHSVIAHPKINIKTTHLLVVL